MALTALVKERMRYALNNDAAAEEVNTILGAASVTNTTELGFLDGVTAGTAAASKALVLNSALGIGTITSLTATNANATTIVATTVNATSSTVTNANCTTSIATTANATSSTATNANCTTGIIGTMNATTGNVTNATLGRVQITQTAVNAAGTNIAGAANLSYGVNIVGAADNSAGVILPVAVANGVVDVISTVNAKSLLIYPQVNSAIAGLSANGALTLGPANTAAAANAQLNSVRLIATNTTQWYVAGV